MYIIWLVYRLPSGAVGNCEKQAIAYAKMSGSSRRTGIIIPNCLEIAVIVHIVQADIPLLTGIEVLHE